MGSDSETCSVPTSPPKEPPSGDGCLSGPRDTEYRPTHPRSLLPPALLTAPLQALPTRQTEHSGITVFPALSLDPPARVRRVPTAQLLKVSLQRDKGAAGPSTGTHGQASRGPRPPGTLSLCIRPARVRPGPGTSCRWGWPGSRTRFLSPPGLTWLRWCPGQPAQHHGANLSPLQYALLPD